MCPHCGEYGGLCDTGQRIVCIRCRFVYKDWYYDVKTNELTPKEEEARLRKLRDDQLREMFI